EVIEAEQPIEILAYELLPDRAGAGKFRGGAPYYRDYKFTEKEAVLQVRSDRARFRPYGLYGGMPGQASANYLNPQEENRKLTSKPTMNIRRGDVFRHELSGGGGWGDPLERDPIHVLKDVRNELVGLASARDDYGVVIDPKNWTVDQDATSALRRELQEKRGWTNPPFVAWDDDGTEEALAAAE
ncbi:MAG: hydantoinase B/oxoprolinase family protein, partial [Rickettsiales bacterium]